MTINPPTVLAVNGSGTDTTSYTIPSLTVQANALVLLFVTNGATAGATFEPTISGTLGLSWTGFNSGTNASDNLRGSFFWAKTGETSATGTITITFSGTQSSCQWHVIEITRADLSDPIVTANQLASITPDDPAVSMPTPAVGSASFGAIVKNNSVAFTPGAGFTTLSDSPSASSPTISSSVEYKIDGSTNVGWITTANIEKVLFAVEVRASSEAAYMLLENGNKFLMESGISVLVE